MTKYILHGGFERRNNELNDSFYQEITKELPDSATLLLVYFASEGEDLEARFKEQSARIRAVAKKSLNIELATKEDFISQVQKADAIHFRGGNTPKLLSALEEYKELAPLLKGKKVISGSSAGGYALVKYGTAHSGLHIREGLGILPLRLVCHFESEENPPSAESFVELQKIAPEFELVLLKDCEWRIFS